MATYTFETMDDFDAQLLSVGDTALIGIAPDRPPLDILIVGGGAAPGEILGVILDHDWMREAVSIGDDTLHFRDDRNYLAWNQAPRAPRRRR